MNYRANHARHYAESQRERQGATGSAMPPRHPAFHRAAARHRALAEEDRLGIPHFTARNERLRRIARNAFIKRMCEQYGAVRTARLLGFAPKTVSQYRAAAERTEREIVELGVDEWERRNGLRE
jgi:hypothetical protein